VVAAVLHNVALVARLVVALVALRAVQAALEAQVTVSIQAC
jgi:hypothetical protein